MSLVCGHDALDLVLVVTNNFFGLVLTTFTCEPLTIMYMFTKDQAMISLLFKEIFSLSEIMVTHAFSAHYMYDKFNSLYYGYGLKF